MKTIRQLAESLPNPHAIPIDLIIQIIMAVMQALAGACPQPVPPKPGLGERWWTRRTVRLQLDDPFAFNTWGRQMADDILDTGSALSPEQFAAVVAEANAESD